MHFSRKLPNIFNQDCSFVSLTLCIFEKYKVIREMNVPLLNFHGKLFWKSTKTSVCFANEDFHIFMRTHYGFTYLYSCLYFSRYWVWIWVIELKTRMKKRLMLMLMDWEQQTIVSIVFLCKKLRGRVFFSFLEES